MNIDITDLAKTPRSIAHPRDVALEPIPELAGLFHSVVCSEHETTYEEAAAAREAKENRATTSGEAEMVVEEGQRNTALTRLAGTMRRRGFHMVV